MAAKTGTKSKSKSKTKEKTRLKARQKSEQEVNAKPNSPDRQWRRKTNAKFVQFVPPSQEAIVRSTVGNSVKQKTLGRCSACGEPCYRFATLCYRHTTHTDDRQSRSFWRDDSPAYG